MFCGEGRTIVIIDDFRNEGRLASNGESWDLFTDQVMGGVSRGSLDSEMVDGVQSLRMRGAVNLENNGGFIQMSLNLRADEGPFDARRYDGIEIDVLGNDETYNVHLRTTYTTRPWQSYRQSFVAVSTWQTLRLPFSGFSPHRIERQLDLMTLKRIGLVAIGREFEADLRISKLALYSADRAV